MSLVFASDLDRTLIYSAAAMRLGRPVAEPVCVEIYDGAPTSFIDPAALAALAKLSQRLPFVPVTTRTQEQFHRITLPGVTFRYAVTTNGAVLLQDGRPCPQWRATVAEANAAGADYTEATTALADVFSRPWIRKVRDAEQQFCYVVLDPAATPPQWYDEVAEVAGRLGWVISVQGRKCYVIPPGLTKEAAVAEVARRLDAERVAAAGDSWLDAGMIAAADLGIRPAHGELAEQSWAPAGVRVTDASGGRAAGEIIGMVAAWAEESTTVSSERG